MQDAIYGFVLPALLGVACQIAVIVVSALVYFRGEK